MIKHKAIERFGTKAIKEFMRFHLSLIAACLCVACQPSIEPSPAIAVVPKRNTLQIPHRIVFPDTGNFELGRGRTILLYGENPVHQGGTQIVNEKVEIDANTIRITTNHGRSNMQFREIYLRPIMIGFKTFPDSTNPIAQRIKIETSSGNYTVYRQWVWNCNPLFPNVAHSHICGPERIRYYHTQYGILAEMEIDRSIHEFLLERNGRKVPYDLMEKIIERENIPTVHANTYLRLLKNHKNTH